MDTVTLAPSADDGGLKGSAFIRSDAVEGSYAISVKCDGGTGSASASITVSGAASASPTKPGRPVNPVPAGGGGTAQLRGRAAAAGTSTGPLLATGGFAAAGLAGLVVRHRRRRVAARG